MIQHLLSFKTVMTYGCIEFTVCMYVIFEKNKKVNRFFNRITIAFQNMSCSQ